MSEIDWNKVKNFSSGEFPEDPNKFADPELLYVLQDIRVDINERIFPSPVSGALARFDGSKTSQHFVGPKNDIVRKSTAIDVFPEGTPILFYSHLLRVKKVNGIGVYMDTNGPDGKPWVMFHFDLRPADLNGMPMIWIAKRVNGVQKYFYPHKDKSMWSLLHDEKFFAYRRKN